MDEVRSRQPYRITDRDCERRFGVVVANFEELRARAEHVFHLTNPKIVLRSDGTVVDEDYFQFIPADALFVILDNQDNWTPNEHPFDPILSDKVEMLSRNFEKLEDEFYEQRLCYGLITFRDAVWRINKKLGRKQYDNSSLKILQTMEAKSSPKKNKNSPKKPVSDDMNYGLEATVKKINKTYRLQENEFLDVLDDLNEAGTNVTHDNKTGTWSPLKRSYQNLISDSKHLAAKKPKLYDEEFKKRIKIPSIETLEKMEQAVFLL